jgi:uncharacterized protein YlzI (FlbEa/FlbD family)
MLFLIVTDKNGTSYSLNKKMISRVVETRDSLMIVMSDGVIIHTKEKLLEFNSRLNSNISF